ncbi:unnamed protein product, partial [Meganyctiphanes norvegica]
MIIISQMATMISRSFLFGRYERKVVKNVLQFNYCRNSTKLPRFIRTSTSLSNTSINNETPESDVVSDEIPKNTSKKSIESPLLKQLQAIIRFNGPLTLHNYMKEVLINPVSGYYMSNDMFGPEGDYITSPEISQMFGEMVAIWIYNEWYKMGSPKPFQLLEFGPGRGTLMKDILRVLQKLGLKESDMTVQMVEMSLHLIEIQESNLCDPDAKYECDESVDGYYKHSSTKYGGHNIYWHRNICTVPKEFTFYLAHEFFDALPIHKLIHTEEGWKELLVDLDDSDDGPHHLRYVISRHGTPAAKVYIHSSEIRKELEVCPEAGVVMNDLARRIEENGGAALIMDYGHNGTETDTFRGFRNHKQQNPLQEPGTADLTADVDFSYLRQQTEDHCVSFGPVSQAFFLKNIGIELRLQNLLKTSSHEQQRNLLSGYKMITSPEQMGERFKFMAIFPAVMKEFLTKFPPAGFHRNISTDEEDKVIMNRHKDN